MRPYFECSDVTIYQGDSRNAWRDLPEHSVDAIVTSPPYFGLRDYGVDGQLGQEASALEFVEVLADLLTGYGERVMKPAGSLWLNLGDTYTDRALALMPERITLALSERGWTLRNRVVWHKTKAMPSPARDRLTARWEPMLHFVRADGYFYDLDAIREPHAASSLARVEKGLRHRHKAGQGHAVQPVDTERMGERFAHPNGANPGDVWSICPGGGLPGSEHIATFPPELVRRPILATVPEQVCQRCGSSQVPSHLDPPRQQEQTTEGGPDAQKHSTSGMYADREVATTTSTPSGFSATDTDPSGLATTTTRATGCLHETTVPGTVLDPFFGSGTTAVMARRLGRRAVGVELNPDYCRLAASRFQQGTFDFGGAA